MSYAPRDAPDLGKASLHFPPAQTAQPNETIDNFETVQMRLPGGKVRRGPACGRARQFGAGNDPLSSLTLFHIHIIAVRSTRVQLARAADFLGRVGDHLFPLGDPADGAAERKDRCEHGG
jgi:hypothetical protein